MSTATWTLLTWTADHGHVASLEATLTLDERERQKVVFSVDLGQASVEISARDAKILIAAKAASGQ